MLQQKRTTVGFIKVETRLVFWLYNAWALVSMLVMVARRFGVGKLYAIRKRAQAVVAIQPQPVHRELRLTYLVVFPEHRGQGYGSAALRLLINALIRETTNDILAEKITAVVRKLNPSARLFEHAGFAPPENLRGDAKDPLADDPAIGPAEFLEITRDSVKKKED